MDKKLIQIQKNEISEYALYKKIAPLLTNPSEREIILRMAEQEKEHYEIWKKITGKRIQPSRIKIWFYYLLTRWFGLSFGLKLMERGEDSAIELYENLKADYTEMTALIKEEREHEEQILNLIKSRFLEQAGSIILGLNDALVELSGVLAGLTLALPNTRFIAGIGLITGLAAAVSMAASSYLAVKEDRKKNPWRAAYSTGLAYLITVAVLISPYLIFTNKFLALTATLALGAIILLVFNFYVAVLRNVSFLKRFAEMALISLGLAIFNFGVGYLVKKYFQI